MTASLAPILNQLAAGRPLTAAETEATFDLVMDGAATPSQIGGLLMAMRVRGETVDEITGAVRAMRARMVAVPAPDGAIDVCGTGGDASGTLNISTAVAFVVAGCGIPVAKHGNRAASSKSGAADVLEALGINLDLPFDASARALAEIGVCFLFAQRHHASARHVGPSRRELGTRTLFNLLGPLANPADVRRQLLGVYAPEWLVPLAQVLNVLGSERAWVVHGGDGLDELTTTTTSGVAELRDGRVSSFEVAPEDAGLPRATPEDLLGGDADANAARLRGLLDGERGPYRDIVALNAAAALVIADRAADLRHGAALAQAAIDDGRARARLDALVRASNQVFA